MSFDALCAACREGDQDKTFSLLDALDHPEQMRLIQKKDDDLRSPFHWAVGAGAVEICSRMLHTCPDWIPVDQDEAGFSPVTTAGAIGSTDILAALLERLDDGQGEGCQRLREAMMAKTVSGATVLHIAASKGHVDAVTMLVTKGFAPVDGRDARKRTPLLRAVGAGQIAVVDALLTLGAKGDAEDADGNGVFHICAEAVHRPLMDWLLRNQDRLNGADPKDKNTAGQTPGDLMGGEDVMETLLRALER